MTLAKKFNPFTQELDYTLDTSVSDLYYLRLDCSNDPLTGALTFSSNSLLVTPIAGTLEFSNNRMYLTNVGKQRAVDRTSDVITSTTTIANTTTETTIFTGVIGANDLKVGNVIKVVGNGVFSTANASDSITFNIKMGSTTLGTITITPKNYTNEHWDGYCLLTVRSIGETGSISVHCDMEAGDNTAHTVTEAQVINLATSENITITAQWSNALAGNTISIYQGLIEFKD